eukprot:6176009-Pleurochrysis_carterae.AAC.1
MHTPVHSFERATPELALKLGRRSLNCHRTVTELSQNCPRSLMPSMYRKVETRDPARIPVLQIEPLSSKTHVSALPFRGDKAHSGQ